MNSTLSAIQISRNWLLTKPYAAIDTEFKINYENKSKPYTIFAASIVDNIGIAQFRHITDFHSPEPEKELVKWLMNNMDGTQHDCRNQNQAQSSTSTGTKKVETNSRPLTLEELDARVKRLEGMLIGAQK